MFEGIDLNQIMKQAQDFQKELEKKKEEGKNKFHSVSVGGGMVELKNQLKAILKKIDLQY